jgi:hypothetical protein
MYPGYMGHVLSVSTHSDIPVQDSAVPVGIVEHPDRYDQGVFEGEAATQPQPETPAEHTLTAAVLVKDLDSGPVNVWHLHTLKMDVLLQQLFLLTGCEDVCVCGGGWGVGGG